LDEHSKIKFYLTNEVMNSINNTKMKNGYLFTFKKNYNYYSLFSLEFNVYNAQSVASLGSSKNLEKYKDIEVIPYNKSNKKDSIKRKTRISNIILSNVMRQELKIMDKFMSIMPDELALYVRSKLPGKDYDHYLLFDMSNSIIRCNEKGIEDKVDKANKEELKKYIKENLKGHMEIIKKFVDYGEKEKIIRNPSFFYVLETD